MGGMDAEVITQAVASMIFFLFLFFVSDIIFKLVIGDTYVNLKPQKQLDWKSRFSSTVHAVVVCVLSTYTLITDNLLTDDPVWGDSTAAMVSLAIVTGYMIADLAIMMWHYSVLCEVSFIYHHLLTAFACVIVMTFRVFHFFAVWRLISEFSTPFLNLRVYLDDAGLRSSKLYAVNGLLFTAAFLASRIGTMPYYYYVLYSIHGTAAFALAGSFWFVLYTMGPAMDVLNMIWARKVIRGFLKGLQQLRATTSDAAAGAQKDA